MSEMLHFQIESPENFLRLACTIRFQKNKKNLDRVGYAWQTLLDTDAGEELFHQFATELFPEGKTLDIDDIDAITSRALLFLDTDVDAKEIQAEYDKHRYSSWVYFKPYHTVYPVGYAQHNDKAKKLLYEYFKGIEDYDTAAFQRFIRENVEIKSTVTSVEDIVKDADWIIRSIVLNLYDR